MDDTATIEPAAQATAGSSHLRRLYETIAAGASKCDAERIHPHDVLGLLREVRFAALSVPVEQRGGGASLRDVIAEAILLAEADTNMAHIFRNHFMFVERFLAKSPARAVGAWEVSGTRLPGPGFF